MAETAVEDDKRATGDSALLLPLADSDRHDMLRQQQDKEKKSSQKSRRMVETRELIHMVHQKKCLWDRTDVTYRDRTAKDKAWKDIYRQIEPSFDSLKPALRYEIGIQITKKWYNVRDSYVKSKKHGRSNRPYLYSDLLTFLDPIYFEDVDASRHEISYNEDRMSNDGAEEGEGSENWLNEVFIDVDEGIAEVPNKRPKLEYETKIKDDLEENETNIVNVLANLIQKEEDDDRAFFKSITPSVKMLSPEAKLEFRIQVMKLLKTLRMEGRRHMALKRERIRAETDSD